MKKLSKILLSLLILFLATNTVIEAEANSDNLKEAILKAKAVGGVTEDYNVFNQSIYTGREGQILYDLNWESEDNNKPSIEISINQDLFIENYRIYSKTIEDKKDNKTEISREDALNLAYEFIDKANSVKKDELYLDEGLLKDSLDSKMYEFRFIRKIDGVIYNQDSIYVDVDKFENKVLGMNSDWSKNLVIDEDENDIGIEAAEKSYKEKVGIELIYRTKYDYEKNTANRFLIYGSDGQEKAISAKDGSAINVLNYSFRNEFVADKVEGSKELSDSEIKVLDAIKGVMTDDKAEKLAREYGSLTDEYNLSEKYFRSYNNIGEDSRYLWSFSFYKGDNESKEIKIDATSGELLNIYAEDKIKKPEGKLSDEELKKISEKFVKDHFKGKFSDLKLSDEDNLFKEENTARYIYNRYHNGVRVDGDWIIVELDNRDGALNQYRKEWSTLEFPEIEVKIDEKNALESLMEKVDLKQEYIIYKKDDEKNVKYLAKGYRLDDRLPHNISIEDGSLLEANGNKYIGENVYEYKDIENSYGKYAIEKLASIGIGFDGDNYYPKKEISQLEYLYLVLESNGISDIKSVEREKEIYQIAEDLKIIKKDEIDPESKVTRAEAIKFSFRLTDFDKIVKKDIYKNVFKDIDNLSVEEKSYIALAYGLDIIKGNGEGYFYPEKPLTREDAAIIVVETHKKL